MIIIKTVCEKCGDILVRSKDIHLHLDSKQAHNYFEFQCPRCGQPGSGEADAEFVRILLANGVKPDVDLQRHSVVCGAPLTWDDYLDFKLDLRQGIIYRELSKLKY